MKKIVGMILMVAMLFGTLAFAEEEFTLHNGTKFGMTEKEVIEAEANKGFELKRDSSVETKIVSIIGIGTIANQENTTIHYYFQDDQLYEMFYKFVTTEMSYNAIENSLIEKYGNTEFSSETGYTLCQTEREDVDAGHSLIPTSNVKYMPLFSQRIVSIEDGKEMLIDHYYNAFGHILIYTILTPEETMILKNVASYSNDL